METKIIKRAKYDFFYLEEKFPINLNPSLVVVRLNLE